MGRPLQVGQGKSQQKGEKMIKIICLIIMGGCTVAIIWSEIKLRHWTNKVHQEMAKLKEQEHE